MTAPSEAIRTVNIISLCWPGFDDFNQIYVANQIEKKKKKKKNNSTDISTQEKGWIVHITKLKSPGNQQSRHKGAESK